jgi:TATA-box binding protein (TBP) (component of TFIID and TFIIIB)
MSSIRRYALAALASAVFAGSAVAKDYELLNVSYDPTLFPELGELRVVVLVQLTGRVVRDVEQLVVLCSVR